jgi:hypothetical protein
MKKPGLIELSMRPVGPFKSPFDEAAFFEWLDKIKCIAKYQGRGNALSIYIRSADVDRDQMREILSVFYRYNIDMKQLSVFDRKEFATWFRRKDAYWYKSVFGKQRLQRKL